MKFKAENILVTMLFVSLVTMGCNDPSSTELEVPKDEIEFDSSTSHRMFIPKLESATQEESKEWVRFINEINIKAETALMSSEGDQEVFKSALASQENTLDPSIAKQLFAVVALREFKNNGTADDDAAFYMNVYAENGGSDVAFVAPVITTMKKADMNVEVVASQILDNVQTNYGDDLVRLKASERERVNFEEGYSILKGAAVN